MFVVFVNLCLLKNACFDKRMLCCYAGERVGSINGFRGEEGPVLLAFSAETKPTRMADQRYGSNPSPDPPIRDFLGLHNMGGFSCCLLGVLSADFEAFPVWAIPVVAPTGRFCFHRLSYASIPLGGPLAEAPSSADSAKCARSASRPPLPATVFSCGTLL